MNTEEWMERQLEQLGSEAEQRSDERRVEPGRRHVLVVEDDPAHRDYLLELLAGWGYEGIPVGSAEEAERAVRQRAIEAAIIDVFLPGRSGAALMSRLRTRFPEAILIGVSALGGAATARRCKGLGADLFLEKPLTPEVLARALQSGRRTWH